MQNNKNILVVDLDGSLIHSDSLLEGFLCLLKQRFWLCFLLPFVLFKGKAALKHFIARHIQFDAQSLPYNQQVLSYIRQKKQQGVSCYLATGACEIIANQVSEYLQLFDGVYASTEQLNLTGKNKAALLDKEFSAQGFIYIGNETVDLAVWQKASAAVVVSNKERLVKEAKAVNLQVEQIGLEKATVKTYLKAIRLHQWVKNALIGVPLLTAHQWHDIEAWYLLVLGFVCFSLTASSVYILNDLLDLAADRRHASKCQRPFAKGVLSLQTGLLLFPLLLILAASLAAFLPNQFVWVLLIYYVLTTAYSFSLKNIIILDSIVLAILYTLRIVAGTVLLAVDFSFWLLAFSLFIFHSLALVKRFTELYSLQQKGDKKAAGRAYRTEDIVIVMALGIASAYIAVLIFALYVNNPQVLELYQHPVLLWLSCPVLLYWISRVWLLAHRGQMHDDPIVFAIKDKQSLLTGVVILAIFSLAL